MKEFPKPSKFCELLGERPYPIQREVMDSILTAQRIAVAAANGVGKTWAAARIAAWFFLFMPNSLVVTTAPTYRQVRFLIWRELKEVHTKLQRLGMDIGKFVTTRWEWPEKGSLALGFAASEYRADRFQGLHAPNLLVIVDEASGISYQIYEQILATLRGKNSFLFMIGNPLTAKGPFAEAFKAGNFKTFKITAFDSPNVQEKRIVVPGLVTAEDIERDRLLFGEDSVYWKTRILAEFPEEETGALFSLEDLVEASQLERDPYALIEAGFDPASSASESKSVIVFRQGPAAYRLEVLEAENLMEMAMKAHQVILQEGASVVKVDCLGLAAGVADRLRELGHGLYEVVPVKGSAKSGEGYQNLRTEMWVKFAQAVKAGKAGGKVFADRRVIHDLLSMELVITPAGKLALNQKDRRHALDFGDALAYAFYSPAGTPDFTPISIPTSIEDLIVRKESGFTLPERPWTRDF